jgi:hypothetical protein
MPAKAHDMLRRKLQRKVQLHPAPSSLSDHVGTSQSPHDACAISTGVTVGRWEYVRLHLPAFTCQLWDYARLCRFWVLLIFCGTFPPALSTSGTFNTHQHARCSFPSGVCSAELKLGNFQLSASPTGTLCVKVYPVV